MEDQTRKERAQRDYHRMQVTALGPFHFDVMTDGDAERRYRVDLVEPSCTCPDFQKRQVKCKHIYRVELEGYEGPDGPVASSSEKPGPGAPSDPDRWRSDANFTWFDAREDMFSKSTLGMIRCYWAYGRKKEIKFWVAIPHFPGVGTLTLCWGDFNEQELRQSNRHLGQSKEIACMNPFDEARSRGKKKLDRGYSPMSYELEELLLDRIATQLAAKGYNPQKVNPDKVYTQTKTKEKPKTNWKPDNEFVWF